MAKQFLYPPINTLAMQLLQTFDGRYNSVPFDYQSDNIPYSQKRQTDDVEFLQVASDWVPTMYFYNYNGVVYKTINPTTPSNSVIGETYTIYQFEIDYNTFAVGDYYAEIHYTDDTPTLQKYQSRPIQVAVTWPQTLLFQFTNSINRFGVVFNYANGSNLTFNLRVEGNIPKGEYTPAFEDVIYTDQEFNPTKLNSVPRREFQLYIASNKGFAGVPTWQADKVNWALGCDQMEIDGVYYQNQSAAKWEVKRTDALATQFIGLQITINEANNKFLQSLKTGTTPPQGFTVVELVDNYLASGADFNVTTFKKYSLLKNITIMNYGVQFTLNIGTTPGGNDIVKNEVIQVPADYEAHNIGLNIPFLSAQTLYVTGLTAGTANCDILFDYLQYDEAAVAPGANPDPKLFPKNFIGMWEASAPTDFNRDWDSTTGLGKIDTDYYGCAMCDGRNGTTDRSGSVALAACFDHTNPNFKVDYDVLGTPVGVSSLRLSLQQLAPHSHPISTTSSGTSGSNNVDPIRGSLQGAKAANRGGGGAQTYNSDGQGLQPQGAGGDGINDVQTIGIVGGNGDSSGFGAPIDNRQLSIVTLYFKKIM